MKSSKIIGVNNCFHDSSFCELENNKIISAIEIERISRKKHHIGLISGDNCLKYIPSGEKVYSYSNNSASLDRGIISAFKISLIYSHQVGHYQNQFLNAIIKKSQQLIKIYKDYKRAIKLFNSQKGIFIDHHKVHASTAYRTSNFKKSNILIADGAGDQKSTSLWYSEDGKLIQLKSYPTQASLGALYNGVTRLLGFRPHQNDPYSLIKNNDEGKVMALSAYGEPKFKIIEYTNKIEINKKTLKYFIKMRKRKRFKKIHYDIAASLQHDLEKVAQQLVQEMRDQTGINQLCIGGGVALNCQMNGKLLMDFNQIHVPFSPADSGTALGAALELNYQRNGKPNIHASPFLGAEYSNSEILKVLKRNNLKYKKYSEISLPVAELIGENKIGGWFQGRMEFGPRALGNRSIIANPSILSNKQKVNKIKNRPEWMPLAPSVISEKSNQYFDLNGSSPFMSFTVNTKKKTKDLAPAIVHQDGTARLQTVTRQNNHFYRLLKEVNKVLGIPIILNTSFNGKGEPIVMSPSDAISAYQKLDLDFIAIGDYLIQKR